MPSAYCITSEIYKPVASLLVIASQLSSFRYYKMDETKNNHKISTFDITKIRNDFPVLNQKIYGKPLIYFDNGATTQKPKVVIDTINELHSKHNSNVHRGIHHLSDQMTKMHESARKKV